MDIQETMQNCAEHGLDTLNIGLHFSTCLFRSPERQRCRNAIWFCTEGHVCFPHFISRLCGMPFLPFSHLAYHQSEYKECTKQKMLRDAVSRYYRCLLCSADCSQAGRSQTDSRPSFLYRDVTQISNTRAVWCKEVTRWKRVLTEYVMTSGQLKMHCLRLSCSHVCLLLAESTGFRQRCTYVYYSDSLLEDSSF
jgi:hypothetical protein